MESMAAADDGCRLWTARSGTGGPLVLCHGGPGWWDTFADLAGLLGRAATGHRWDQRGCGRSERRGPYTLARSLADLDAVRRHHRLGRTVLLGHSWGAELALAFALAHPGLVTALVYVAGTGIDPDEPWHDQFERNLRDRLGRNLHRWPELRRRPARSAAEERELMVLQLSADFADRDRALEHGTGPARRPPGRPGRRRPLPLGRGPGRLHRGGHRVPGRDRLRVALFLRRLPGRARRARRPTAVDLLSRPPA